MTTTTHMVPGAVVDATARDTTPPRRAGRSRQLGRHNRRSLPVRVARAVAALVLVRLAVTLVGPALVAVVVGLVVVVAGLRWWARVVEPWLFAPRTPRPARPARPVGGMDHVAFARALALMADRYRAECERHATGPGAGSELGSRQ